MRPTLVLVVMFLSAAPGLAQEEIPRPQTGQIVEQEAEQPAPQLVQLDSSLLKAQEDRQQGRLDEKGYQEFLAKFRVDLEAAISLVTPTPANTTLHARILSRLGDSGQALAALAPALEQDPASPALRVALSQVLYDRKDYAGALAEANAVLARDPMNKAALALKYSSEGRIGTGGAAPSKDTRTNPGGAGTGQFRSPLAKDSPEVQALVPRIRAARDSGDISTAMTLAQDIMRAEPTSEYAQEIYRIVAKDHSRWQRDQKTIDRVDSAKASLPADPAPKSGGIPLWPILPFSGLGAAAFVVAKSRRTVESEDGFDEENRPIYGKLQQFVAGSVLAGLAGAGLYLGGAATLSVGAPFAARIISGPGQQAMRLAQSEIGAINPGQVKAANEVPEMLARVIPLKDGVRISRMIGPPGQRMTFVTAAEDIAHTPAAQLAARLGIESAPRYAIIRFPTPSAQVASRIVYHENPLFIGRGLTSGRAREFQVPNMPIPRGATIEIVEVVK